MRVALALAALTTSAVALAEPDPYAVHEDGPQFEVVDGEARSMSPGRRRCDDALIDPVPVPLAMSAGAALGAASAGRSACLRDELSVQAPLSALIDTPGFHGEIDAALQLAGRLVVRRRLELSAGVSAARFQFVQNAVNKATGVQLGPLAVGAAYGQRWGASAFAVAGVIELPFTRDDLETTHLAGTLTAVTAHRLSSATTLHARLGFVGGRAWSLGGTTGRMAFRAGADLVRRTGERWSLDAGAEVQAGWYDGFDGTTLRLGAQRRLGQRTRGMLGVGLPVGGDERTNAIVVLGVAIDPG